MIATTRPCSCRRPLTRALTAALLLAAACDDPDEVTEAELEADVEEDAGDESAAADGDGDRAGAFAAELAATQRFVERAAIVDHEVCGEAKAPASVDVEVLWGRSAAGVGRLRVDVDEASDAEVAIDVAVVVAGETVDELRGAAIVGPEALERADFAGDGDRPYAIEAELDLRDALAALDVDHGMLVVVAKLRRGDGTVAAADRPLYLFFERDEAGLEL
ncbi:MAG: hypothetical protein KC486_27795, partial [Myxococcales bacterium]|nr:hypothetical protein [Myxococcales bacterium]